MKKIIIPTLAILTVLITNIVGADYANDRLQELQQALELKPDDTKLLNETGLLLLHMGKDSEAEPLLQKSLSIREKELGQNHPDIVETLSNLADIYKRQGKYGQAEPLLQRCLNIREKESAQDSSHLASLRLNMAVSSLAHFYDVQGKYKQAEAFYLRSVEIEEKNLKEDDINPILHSDTLGLFYERQLKYAEAEHFYQRSLATQEKIYQHNLVKQEKNAGKTGISENERLAAAVSITTALERLAGIYEMQAKYKEAELLYLRNLGIKEKTLGKDFPETTKSEVRLAKVYRIQGKYEQAEPMYQRALEKFEKILTDAKDQLSGFRMREGVAFKIDDMPNLSKLQLVWDRNNFAAALNELALLYDEQGRYDKAELLYLKSIAIDEKTFGKDTPEAASALDNLASIYEKQGKYEQAEQLHQKALEHREQALGKDHPDIATSLNNLASLYAIQSNYAKSEPLYLRSIAIDEKVLGKDHPSLATSLNNLAALYYSQRKFEAAEPLLKRSLTIRENALGKNHVDVASTLNHLAMLYSAEDRYAEAAPLFQKSLRIMNQSLERWLWGASEKTRKNYLQNQENNREIYLSFYSFYNMPEEAFYFSLSRKSLLLSIASEMNALAKQSTDHETQKQVAEFSALKAQLANLIFSTEPESKAKIQELEEQSNNLERELIQKVAAFKRSNTEITPGDVLKKLKPEQVLVDFLVYKDVDFKINQYKTEQVIALIVGKENDIQLIKLGELSPIAEAIKTYRTAIVPTEANHNIREQTLTETAKALYQQLWQPLTPYLKNKKTVYLIPDDILHLLPFKALQDPNGKYLAENYQLITLSSARDIVLPPLEGKAGQSAIFAAPDYGNNPPSCNSRGTELQNIFFCTLANAQFEGNQINKLFFKKQPNSPAKLFVRAEATEKAITALTAPKILHLSTHGFFLSDIQPDEKNLVNTLGFMRSLDNPLPMGKIENPLTRSGLAFANANLGTCMF